MNVDELMTGVFWGALLIILGLVPGLFQRFVEGTYNFITLVTSGVVPATGQPVRQPAWLAVVGAALIALSVIGYLSA